MHRVRLGKRERASHEAAQSLAQRVVEAFNVARLPRAFARRPMLLLGQCFRVCLPEVSEQHPLLIPPGNALPQEAASLLTSVADGIRHNLACPSALGQPVKRQRGALARPHPAFVSPVMDE